MMLLPVASVLASTLPRCTQRQSQTICAVEKDGDRPSIKQIIE